MARNKDCGTPLLDIKPYVPKFDALPDARAGWLDAQGETLEGRPWIADFDRDNQWN